MEWRVVPRLKISSTLTNPNNDPLRSIRPKEEIDRKVVVEVMF